MTYVRQARADRYKRILILIVGAAAILLLSIAAAWVKNDNALNKQSGINLPSSEQGSRVNLVRTSRSVEAGETADITKFEIIAVPEDLVPEGAVKDLKLLKNKRVTDNLGENEILVQSDLVDSAEWYEEGDRLVEHTFQNGAIPAAVEAGSVVDIKLFRQGAEDNVVVSKAVIVGKMDNTLSFYLDSVEQEHLKEANAEGLLFLVQYLDKAQAASAPTYIPVYGDGRGVERE